MLWKILQNNPLKFASCSRENVIKTTWKCTIDIRRIFLIFLRYLVPYIFLKKIQRLVLKQSKLFIFSPHPNKLTNTKSFHRKKIKTSQQFPNQISI